MKSQILSRNAYNCGHSTLNPKEKMQIKFVCVLVSRSCKSAAKFFGILGRMFQMKISLDSGISATESLSTSLTVASYYQAANIYLNPNTRYT